MRKRSFSLASPGDILKAISFFSLWRFRLRLEPSGDYTSSVEISSSFFLSSGIQPGEQRDAFSLAFSFLVVDPDAEPPVVN